MAPRESFTCTVPTRLNRTVATEQITHFIYSDKFASAFYPGGDLLLNESVIALQAEFGDLMVRAHRNMLVRKDAIRSIRPRTGTSVFDMTVEGVQAPLQVSRSGRKTVLEARPDLRGPSV